MNYTPETSNIDKGPKTVKATIGGISLMMTSKRARQILELQRKNKTTQGASNQLPITNY